MFFIFLEFIINLTAPIQNFVKSINLMWFYHILIILRVQYTYLHTTCTIFQTCRLFLKIINQLLDFVHRCLFPNVYEIFLHKNQRQQIVLNHFQLRLCMVLELCTWERGDERTSHANVKTSMFLFSFLFFRPSYAMIRSRHVTFLHDDQPLHISTKITGLDYLDRRRKTTSPIHRWNI